MKQLLTLFFTLILCSHTFAQINFFPEGAEWYLSFNSPGLIIARGHTHCIYARDTIIAGREAHVIERTTYYFDYHDPTIPTDTIVESPQYLSQSEDSILIFANDHFQLLWRTNVAAGDSFQLHTGPWGDLFTMRVDTTTLVNIDGHEVNSINIHGGTENGRYGTQVIYDQFGPYHGFTYYGCWGLYDCNPSRLCKYVNDEIGEVYFPGIECELLISGTETSKLTYVAIYPNPAQHLISIAPITEPTQIEFFNAAGQFIRSLNASRGGGYGIDISDLLPGMYFVRITNDQGSMTRHLCITSGE